MIAKFNDETVIAPDSHYVTEGEMTGYCLNSFDHEAMFSHVALKGLDMCWARLVDM